MKKNITLGSWLTLNNPYIAEVLSSAGFDWLCVDMEHSITDYADAQAMILTIQSRGLKAFVRVGENNSRIIKRVLDAGADGIIVPMVNTLADAQRAVSAVYYPPKGSRGVGLARAQNYGFGFEDYKDGKAREITLIAQIEHVDAVQNLEQILALDDIDGTIIGPYDLSGSMGKPGQWNDADVVSVLEAYENIARQSGKLMGYHVIQPDHRLVLEKIAAGYDFIAFSLDSLFLGTLAKTEMQKIRGES